MKKSVGKKIFAILLVLIILTVSSAQAFAGKTEGMDGTTQSAINGGGSTSGAITSGSESGKTSTSGSGIAYENDNAVGSGIAGDESTSSEGDTGTDNSADKSDSGFRDLFDGLLTEGTAVNDGQVILEITSPDKDKDSTYRKSYIISGNTKYDDVVITIAKYNEDTGKYELMQNTDGESSWEIGAFRLTSKEIVLTKGTNKIKIMAHRTSQMAKASRADIQINCFTIELLNESIIGKVTRKTAEITSGVSKALGIDDFLRNRKK